jgi:hypothetical protein
MSSTQRPLVRPMKTGDAAERLKTLRRAEELRVIAEETIDEDTRVVLLRLAQCYERMAACGEVETPAPAPRHNPWPLKFRVSGDGLLPRSVPRRTA